VVFVSSSESLILTETLGEYLDLHPVYAGVIILGLTYNRGHLHQQITTGEIRDRLPTAFRCTPDILQLLTIGVDGKITNSAGETLSEDIANSLYKAGAETIFFESNTQPVLEVPLGFHFVKPSKWHASHFIRVAEVLNESSTVEFLAAALLRYTYPEVNAISCDTGSILVVCYALQTLLDRFGHHNRFVSIASFGSWAALRGESLSRIKPDPSTLYLISTSTFGKLAAELKLRGFEASNIVTLYYYGLGASIGSTICRLDKTRSDGSAIMPDIKTFPPDECPYCRLGSYQLEVRGDHFLPLETHKDLVELDVRDVPGWLQAFMIRALGTEGLTLHYGRGRMSRVHDIFIHFERLCRGSLFNTRLMQGIRQSVPFGFQRMYVCDDVGARHLADIIRNEMKAVTTRSVDIVSARDLERDSDKYLDEEGSSLVVAGCVASGRSLMKISRLLRNVAQRGVTFFVGLQRTESREDQEHLESTVRFASDGKLRFGYQSVENIFVPDNTPLQESIWTKEVRLLEYLLGRRSDFHNFPVEQVESRLGLLKDSESDEVGGLRADLFWPRGEESLRLRSNFSFLSPSQAYKAANQAEIYFAISAILHNIRSSKFKRRGLAAHRYVRTLLAPSNFGRFNDGIIQACFLRASLPGELDYEIDERADSDMCGLLCDMIKGDEPGEAITEFLLALALQQIRLSPRAVREVITVAEGRFRDQPSFDSLLIQSIHRMTK
jgi:hypothetical protein